MMRRTGVAVVAGLAMLVLPAPVFGQDPSPLEQQRAATIARTASSLVEVTATVAPKPRPVRDLSGLIKRSCNAIPDARWDEGSKQCRLWMEDIPPREQKEQGAGFLIDAPRGLILTAAHIVKDWTLAVRLPDGRDVPAELAAADSDIGLAVVRIAPEEVARAAMTALPLAATPPKAGYDALLIGRSIPLDSVIGIGGQVIGAIGDDNLFASDTAGRNLPVMAPQFLLNIRLPDGSLGGGPVLDSSGKATGILLAMFGTRGDNNATLMVGLAGLDDRIAELAAGQVRARGWLGVNIDCPNRRCVAVQVVPDSPAAEAGVKVGDVVTTANGQAVNSSFALLRIVRRLPPASAITLRLERDGTALPDMAVTSGNAADMPPPGEFYPPDADAAPR
jgi:serine protease Do